MRLLHPETIRIVAELDNTAFKGATVTKRTVVAHAWSECLKWLATGQEHPKMFIANREHLGAYIAYVKHYGDMIGCNLNDNHLLKYDDVWYGYVSGSTSDYELDQYFDDLYLLSDAISLYYKGLNILPSLYGEDWKKYIPVESLKEVNRQICKTMGK